jgi:ABC-type dipeptide/oligopeptide/nickel transport system permease component
VPAKAGIQAWRDNHLMLRLLLWRLALIPVTVLGVVTVLFLIFKSVPGDEATMVAGATATQAEIDIVRHQLGLDRPLLVQYSDRIVGLLHGDLGYSATFRTNSLPRILERVPATLLLTVAAIVVTVLIGIPAGILAAYFHRRLPDFAISASVIALLAVPNFWLGMMLIALLSVQLHWLPSLGFTGAASLVMPTIALAARLIALVGRLTRGVVIEEQRKDYVRTAYAKGLAASRVMYRHVLRNALVPIVTVVGLETGYLLGGSVVVERLFAWPGIGDLLLTAVGLRDYTLVQGITVLFVIGFLLINLVVEMLYRLINPRLR